MDNVVSIPVIAEGCLTRRRLHDPQERVGLQARPADQCPVHVRLRHQPGGVLGGDGTAVEDGKPSGDFLAIELGQPHPDDVLGGLGLLRGGNLAGADGPDRLVGDDQPVELVVGQARTGGVDLPLEDPLLEVPLRARRASRRCRG